MNEENDNNDTKKMVSLQSQSLSPTKRIKSTAVVKHSSVRTPAKFIRLQCNTNLNLPPSNWLRDSADSYGLQHVFSHSTGFSSFRMAHMFPDCVGEVDVVSDAENIKALLKLPYSHAPISMMVHRIENTLLIDDFDIYKHLLRTAETEWTWLKKFFVDHIQKAITNKERYLRYREKSRNALQQKSLMSKFLYYSLAESSRQENEERTEEENEPTDVPSGPALPEPNIDEEMPGPTTNHKYNRNVVWTFEDIQMLIGTDMPIFGGSTHPCISLRLRNMNKPISVLTGIDYWLDNLMSNVPEVVMCYHLDGIVQKYEFIKTEDLPYLDNSKFSPKLIRDIAQNILSFLKSNATKAGHTYWLFKGKDDDVVKLYDLTSLCADVSDEKEQNPFTVPVAMLLYRVARNMQHSGDYSSQSGTIRMLLKNCVSLLNKVRYPQIVTSSHYILSDLYVPARTNPNCPNFENLEKEQNESIFHTEEIDNEESVKLLRLNETSEYDANTFKNDHPLPVSGSVKERCCQALTHIAAGLECLKYFPSNEKNEYEQEKIKQEASNLKMAHPSEPIPMPYSSLNENNTATKAKKNKKKSKKRENVQTTNTLIKKPNADTVPIWQEPNPNDNASWNTHLKTLLKEKACLIYATLAEHEFIMEEYGHSLRHLRMLGRCDAALARPSLYVDTSYLLGRIGDCCCMIEKQWPRLEEFREQYSTVSETDDDVSQEMLNDVNYNESRDFCHGILPDKLENSEQMLLISIKCYTRALSSAGAKEKINLSRRLGNVHNELGSVYMDLAASTHADPQPIVSMSLKHLTDGTHCFESIDDKINLALLHMNMGRLMRVCAMLSAQDRSPPTLSIGQEKLFYTKAIDSYKHARIVLVNRKLNPEIWDAASWDLSTTAYNMVTQLLNNSDTLESEQEIVEMLQKSLEYCDIDTVSPRQPLYQYRAAEVHRKLANIYQNNYKKLATSNPRRKSVFSLAKLHFEKATSILLTLDLSSEFIEVQLEYVTLFVQQNQNGSVPNSKLNYANLFTALHLLIDTIPMLNALQTSTSNAKEDKLSDSDEEKSTLNLLKNFQQFLQFILLNLAKLFTKPVKGFTSELCLKYANVYKQFYSSSLLNSKKTTNVNNLAKSLAELLNQIKNTSKTSVQ